MTKRASGKFKRSGHMEDNGGQRMNIKWKNNITGVGVHLFFRGQEIRISGHHYKWCVSSKVTQGGPNIFGTLNEAKAVCEDYMRSVGRTLGKTDPDPVPIVDGTTVGVFLSNGKVHVEIGGLNTPPEIISFPRDQAADICRLIKLVAGITGEHE